MLAARLGLPAARRGPSGPRAAAHRPRSAPPAVALAVLGRLLPLPLLLLVVAAGWAALRPCPGRQAAAGHAPEAMTGTCFVRSGDLWHLSAARRPLC